MTLRRAIDIAVGVFGLAAGAPVMLAIAAAVLLVDGRPVLFVQARSGLGAGTFRLVKFRTMRSDADASGAPLPDAARTTKLGRLLRRLRIDELPQLWNVAAGDMSLIGPRPLLPATIAAAGEAGVMRGQVRPGLTGLAQVSGNTLLTENEKIALDVWYVAHRSPALDLAIAVRTIRVALLGERRDVDAIGRAYASGTGRGG